MKRLIQILIMLSIIATLSACSNDEESNIDNLADELAIQNQEEILKEEIEEIYLDAFDFIHLTVEKAIKMQNVDYYLNNYKGMAGGRLMYSDISPYTFEFEGWGAPDINEPLLYTSSDDLSKFTDNIPYIILDFSRGATVNGENFNGKTAQEILNLDSAFELKFSEMYDEYYMTKIYEINNSTTASGVSTHELTISFSELSDIVKVGTLSNK